MSLLLLGAGAGEVAAGGGGSPVTWDPANKSSLVALDGTKLIGTKSGGDSVALIRGTTPLSVGQKARFEVLQSINNPNMVGICTPAFDATGTVDIAGSDAAAGYNFDGYWYNNAHYSTVGATWGAGTWIGIEVDNASGGCVVQAVVGASGSPTAVYTIATFGNVPVYILHECFKDTQQSTLNAKAAWHTPATAGFGDWPA